MEATLEMPATEQAPAEAQAAGQPPAPVNDVDASAAPTVQDEPQAADTTIAADAGKQPDLTPEEKKAKRIANLEHKIGLQRIDVSDRAVAVEEAEEEKKSRQKAFDVAVEYLRTLQRELKWAMEPPAEEPAPLFDNPEFKSAASAAPAAPAPAEDESWKSLTLEQLGLSSSRVLKALRDHEPPISTFGELAAWQEKKADFWAKDIKGLGDKGRDEIESAQLSYWQAHPRETKAAEPAPPASTAEVPQTEAAATEPTPIDPAAHVGSNGDGKHDAQA